MKSKYIKSAFFLSPFFILPFWNIALATNDYLHSKAEIRFHGLPFGEAWNLDNKYRVGQKAIGCGPTGIEPFTSYPYNSTIKYLVTNHGFQKDIYKGVYPNYKEALNILSDSSSIVNLKIFNNHFYIKNDSLNIDFDLTQQHYVFRRSYQKSKKDFKPRARIINNECLVCNLGNN